MTVRDIYGEYSFDSVGELALADPADFWISIYTRMIDGGYPGEGCVVDDLVITTAARGTDDLKSDGRLYVTRLDDVREWHREMVRLAEQWLAEGMPWHDVWPDVEGEINWPAEVGYPAEKRRQEKAAK